MKNKGIILIILGVLSLVAIIAISLIVLIPKKIHVASISLPDESIKLYVGDSYSLEYNITPTNATNQNVKIDISNKNIVEYNNNLVNAIASGETKLCVISEENDQIFSCIDINVTTKREEFIAMLDRVWKKTADGIYSFDENISININNYTFVFTDEEAGLKASYIYHFKDNYVDGWADMGNNFSVQYWYNPSTKLLSCVGSTTLVQQTACGYANQSVTINLFEQIIEFANVALGDYTVDDLVIN